MSDLDTDSTAGLEASRLGSTVVLLLVYIALLVTGLLGMRQLRKWAIDTYDTPVAQHDWSRWQDETQRQSEGNGPVTRGKAKSDEPPALVLARDYYGTLVTIFVLLGTVLFATVAMLFRGALRSPGSIHDDIHPSTEIQPLR